MRDSIINFAKQFSWEPKIENAGAFPLTEKFIHAGMGGSQLACDILRQLRPDLDIVSHRSYGLPKLREEDLKSKSLIANSYSGNTEEIIDSLEEGLRMGLPALVIATGGKLLEIAKSRKVAYIELPSLGVEPRMSTGVGLRAILKAMGEDEMLRETSLLATKLDTSKGEAKGAEIAKQIKGGIPIVYASDNNFALARNWKIKFNETGKTPAFWNVLPELNHNEMTGFPVFIEGIPEEAKKLSEKFHFIFLKDSTDHPRIKVRFEVLHRLFTAKGMKVIEVDMEGESPMRKVFSAMNLGDWTALYLAEEYGLPAKEVAIVEEFKRLIQK